MIFHGCGAGCPLHRAIGNGPEEHLSLTRKQSCYLRQLRAMIATLPSLSNSERMARAQRKEPDKPRNLRVCSSHPFWKTQKSVLHVDYNGSMRYARTATVAVVVGIRVTVTVAVVITVAVMVAVEITVTGAERVHGTRSQSNRSSGSHQSSDRNRNSSGCNNGVGAMAAASVLAGGPAAEDAVELQRHSYGIIQSTCHLVTQLTQLPMD